MVRFKHDVALNTVFIEYFEILTSFARIKYKLHDYHSIVLEYLLKLIESPNSLSK